MGLFYSIWRRAARAAGRRCALLPFLALAACAPLRPALPPPAAALTVPPPAVTLAAPATPLGGAQAAATPSPAPPTITPSPMQPTATPTLTPVPTVWPRPISRFELVAELPDADLTGRVLGFHLTTSDVTFRVHYSPGAPHYISQWANLLSREGPAPLLIIPGGFFSADYLAQGLLVADGEQYSQAHDIGGVFVVQEGRPQIRWLQPEAIAPGEEFEQGVQSFPVYAYHGEQVFVNEHVARAPRTVLVETTSGDFIVLLSLTALFRTTDMPAWLAQSGLGVFSALNLDGGRSTGYWAGEEDYYDSFVPLPAVIAVYRN